MSMVDVARFLGRMPDEGRCFTNLERVLGRYATFFLCHCFSDAL